MGKVKRRKKEEYNPMYSAKWDWLWILCFPVALVASIHYESKEDMRVRKAKRAKKDEEFRRKYPEFDCWQDNQGL